MYYAYINSDNICVSVWNLPEAASASYIPITEEQYTSQSVVGMRWNATAGTWEEVVQYFYAVLDENDICINVVELEAESTDPYYIAIDSLDQSLIGQWYDRANQVFQVEVPFHVTAAHSTNEINVGTSDVSLTTKLNQLETAIENAGTGSGSGEAGAAGADGEDGGYYTPAVSEDGTLSWTASKEDMPAVASANIKGADGAAGQDGAPGANGVTFTPAVSSDGTLSWTNDGGLENPAPVNIKGESGDAASVDAYTKVETDNLLAGKADSMHSHSEYATVDALATKADSSHTHTGYASSSHTHSGYASSSHTHSGYLSTSGGTLSGNLTVNGVVYVSGKQALYNSGTQMIIGTGNLATTIACASSSDVTVNGARMQIPSLLPRNGGSFQIGNATYRFSGIYLTNSPNVSSDARCKENVAGVNVDDVLEFVSKLPVCTYNYKDDSTARIGLVAQDVIAADATQADFYVDHDTETDLYSIRPADLVFPLIAAVQALSARVAALEK